MFGRKILFLTAGYVAGNIVSSLYKKEAKIQKGEKKNTEKKLVEEFVETQKNFLNDIENKYLSEEQKNSFQEKKKEFLKASEGFFAKAKKVFTEVASREEIQKGKDKLSKTFKKVGESVKNFSEEKDTQDKK